MKPVHTLLFIFLACAVCLGGCAMPRPRTDPGLDRAAGESAARLRAWNQDITSSKGTAGVRLETSTGVQTYQMAWAARAPDRVRITFTVSGHPVETVVADGTRVTFISHTGRHKPHTPASNDPDLEPYTRVPVRLSDLITLLLGQIPVKKFDDAWFPSRDRFQIRLGRKFSSLSQELVLQTDDTIKVLRLLDKEGDARYEINFHAFDTIGAYTIPVHMTIFSEKLLKAHIRIKRFLPNIPVEDSVFRLTQTGS
ncbi:MAG: hypothetical protein R6V15_14855 [Desulfotignum sp.]